MENIPEFEGDNRSRVQGGRYPTQIWKAFMDPALAGLPPSDWEAPPPPARPAARLYLPGNECLAQAVTTGGDVVGTVPPAAAGGARPPARPGSRRRRSRRRHRRRRPRRRRTPTVAPPTAPTLAPGTPITAPRVTRLVPVESGTTVPPDVLDPRAPLPSTPLSNTVIRC